MVCFRFKWSTIHFWQMGNWMPFGEIWWCQCKTCCSWGLEITYSPNHKLENRNAAEAMISKVHRHRVADKTCTAHQAPTQIIIMKFESENWPRTWPAPSDVHAWTTFMITVAQWLGLCFSRVFFSRPNFQYWGYSNTTPCRCFRRFRPGPEKVNIRDCSGKPVKSALQQM